MWLIPPHSGSSAPAPATADSMKPSDLSFRMLASCAALNGKHAAPKSWHAAMKRKAWLRSLLGRISARSVPPCVPSPLICSAPGTRASRGPMLARSLERTIRGTFGPSWRDSFEKADPGLLFSRTSPAICETADVKCSESYTRWVTALRAHSSERMKSARLRSAPGCSSSLWPTTNAADHKTSADYPHKGGNPTLVMAAARFSHPAQARPAPGANDHKGSAVPGQRRGQLDEATEHWVSPNVPTRGAESKESRGAGGVDLQTQASNWQTPNAGNAHTRRQLGETQRESLLPAQAEQWQSPGNFAGGTTSRSGERIGEKLLAGQAEAFRSSHQVPGWVEMALSMTSSSFSAATLRQLGDAIKPSSPTPSHGSTPSTPDRTSRPRLNPRFTEWLMGWATEWTAFEAQETEWSHCRARMRSWLVGLLSTPMETD